MRDSGPLRRFTLIGGVAVCVGACSILYGPSDAEFSGGSKDGGTSSASSGTLPDGAIGPAGEGGTSSGTTSSGGTDAPAFVCPSGSLVCDDFEGSTPSPVLAQKGAADGTKIVAGGRASAHGLAATFANASATMLEATFEEPHVEMSLWIRTDGPPPADPDIKFRVASLLFGEACDWELTWQIFLSTDGLHEGTDSYDAASTGGSCGPVKYHSNLVLDAAKVFDGQWHHVVVDADSTARLRKTSTFADALAPVVEEVESVKEATSTTVAFDFGMPCVLADAGCFGWKGPPFTVYFDQVTLTTK